MIALKNIIFKSSTNYFQTHVLILTAKTHWIKGNVSKTKMHLEMRSAAFQKKKDKTAIALSKKYFKNVLITPQYVFWFSQQTHIWWKEP